jgi:hypothetical protein
MFQDAKPAHSKKGDARKEQVKSIVTRITIEGIVLIFVTLEFV